jgi:hypothetical protein
MNANPYQMIEGENSKRISPERSFGRAFELMRLFGVGLFEFARFSEFELRICR